MNYQIPMIAGLLGIGVVLGATLSGNDSDGTSTVDNPKATNTRLSVADNTSTTIIPTLNDSANLNDIKQAVQSLQQQLQQEMEKRKYLEQKVALLEKQLDSEPSTNVTASKDAEVNEESVPNNPHQAGSFSQNNDWFNEQAMLNAGVDSTKVNYIKNAFEQAEMDKLYLRDQATREGWLDSERYTTASKEILDRTEALRNQLSEKEYDAYLYAAGRSNRVKVESVLSTSPASNAGIQPGDTILRYDNKRIYSWTDLTSATSSGTANDTVSVTIERNGQSQQVYVPRGPLGIRLITDSVAP